MAKQPSKRYRKALEMVDATKSYPLKSAVEVLGKFPRAKFNETVEIAFRLGVDPKQSDQMVRGTVILPHGLGGKSKVVAVIASGDKQREGDLATPEGDFYICYKNFTSKYHRFLGISYPNVEDAERGLREGLITRTEHDQICAAIAQKQCPPWKTPLGGEVGLHGPCPNVTWTHGCIAMSVEHIERLYELLEIGDQVTILP